MRKVGCYLLLACAAAFGQAAPEAAPAADDAQVKAMVDALKKRLEGLDLTNLKNPRGPIRLQALPMSKPTVCAIPLLHVVPPGTYDKMTFVQPSHPVREDGGTVKVPAPACDEHLFTNGPSSMTVPAPVLPVEPQAPKQ